MSQITLATHKFLTTGLTLETVFRVSLDVSVEICHIESFATNSADASLVVSEMFLVLLVIRKLSATGLTLDQSSMAADSLVFPLLALSVESFITNFTRQSSLTPVRTPQVSQPTVFVVILGRAVRTDEPLVIHLELCQLLTVLG